MSGKCRLIFQIILSVILKGFYYKLNLNWIELSLINLAKLNLQPMLRNNLNLDKIYTRKSTVIFQNFIFRKMVGRLFLGTSLNLRER